MTEPTNELVEKAATVARESAEHARVHLSDFHVGAAMVTTEEQIYGGCNIEFDNYTNTIHAEESAIVQMVMNDHLEATPWFLAVYTKGDTLWFPCGLCRQSLYEFGGPELRVYPCNDDFVGRYKTMEELLPGGFRLLELLH